ncbi:MAG: hypothetical protein LBP59_19385 [Planctomycetaceae bacterium]|jgi:TrmH family RNA methyltransferase|nr:hypothetical protein [Planctomycetaceae bacterium]
MIERAIVSFSNPKIKDAIKLRDSGYRRASRRFLIDGLREIERAIFSGVQCLEFFVLESKVDVARKFAGQNNVTINIISELLIQKIGFGNRNDGIVAVAETPVCSFDLDNNFPQKINLPNKSDTNFDADLSNKSVVGVVNNKVDIPLFVVLEGIEKPGNIGAIFRSADGAGVSGIILVDNATDLYNPNIIRSSLGTLFSIPVVETTAMRTKEWLLGRNIKMAVAKCGGDFLYAKYDFCQPTAIVLGSEAEGLTDKWDGDNVTSITIPMCGIADSLNVSAAAAILLYEAKRQRTQKNVP